MWDILRPTCWRICVSLCIEYEYEVIGTMKSIRYIFRPNFASWLPRLITYGCGPGWVLGFGLGLSFGMVLVSPDGYSLGYSINILFGLAYGNYFASRGGYLVGVSLGTLSGLAIVPGEGFLVGLSLVLPLGYLLEYPNHGSDITDTLLVAPLELWFGSEAVRFLCC